jgi:predicted small secreted protein
MRKKLYVHVVCTCHAMTSCANTVTNYCARVACDSTNVYRTIAALLLCILLLFICNTYIGSKQAWACESISNDDNIQQA